MINEGQISYLKAYHRLGGWFPREAKNPASVRRQNRALTLTMRGETDENPKCVIARPDPKISSEPRTSGFSSSNFKNTRWLGLTL